MAAISSVFSRLLATPSGILLAVLLVVALLLLPSVYRIAKQQWDIYCALRLIPCDQKQHWLLGHAPKILGHLSAGTFGEYSVQQTKQFGSLTVLHLGPFFSAVICLRHDTGKIGLASDPKADLIYFPLMPWLGNSVLTGSGKRWARTRRLLTPAFHFDVLKPYIRVYAQVADVLVDLWSKEARKGKSFDIFPYISLAALDVMLRCTCSFESNCQTTKTHTPYISSVYELSNLVVSRVLFFPAYLDWVYALMPESKRFNRSCKIVHKFSMDVIKKRRAELNEKKEKGEDALAPVGGKRRKYLDFIDVLLEARDEEGCGLTDEEIRAEVDTFMFEGHDTTAAGIAWTLYNLAQYPDHQAKCRAEVDEIFEEKGELEWEDLKKMTYLKYCIKESLRLFPPVAIVGRKLATEKKHNEYVLPVGTWVMTDIYSFHHDESVWEDSETFNPLRFTPENSKGRPPHAFVPFSMGPRNCIGQEFALNEEKVVLAHILRKFELSFDESRGPVRRDQTLITRPKDGLYLSLKERL